MSDYYGYKRWVAEGKVVEALATAPDPRVKVVVDVPEAPGRALTGLR
jgi:hypothetical protein